MAQLIDTNGDVHQVEGPVSLEQAQSLVGGYVERVPAPLEVGQQMLVNEEGLMHGLPFNMVASLMTKMNIVGNALIVETGEGWDD